MIAAHPRRAASSGPVAPARREAIVICPKCKADTRVIDSRTAPDGKVIRRRRVCTACPHRFSTFESTLDVAARRQRAAKATAAYRAADPDRAREQDARRGKTRSIRNMARAEAAETGRPVAEILKQWEATP